MATLSWCAGSREGLRPEGVVGFRPPSSHWGPFSSSRFLGSVQAAPRFLQKMALRGGEEMRCCQSEQSRQVSSDP